MFGGQGFTKTDDHPTRDGPYGPCETSTTQQPQPPTTDPETSDQTAPTTNQHPLQLPPQPPVDSVAPSTPNLAHLAPQPATPTSSDTQQPTPLASRTWATKQDVSLLRKDVDNELNKIDAKLDDAFDLLNRVPTDPDTEGPANCCEQGCTNRTSPYHCAVGLTSNDCVDCLLWDKDYCRPCNKYIILRDQFRDHLDYHQCDTTMLHALRDRVDRLVYVRNIQALNSLNSFNPLTLPHPTHPPPPPPPPTSTTQHPVDNTYMTIRLPRLPRPPRCPRLPQFPTLTTAKTRVVMFLAITGLIYLVYTNAHPNYPTPPMYRSEL